MIKVNKYTQDLKPQWNEFIKNSKNGTFLLDRNYMEYHSDRFTDNSLVFFNDKDKIIAVLPACKIEDGLYSHAGLSYGGIISDNNMKSKTMLDVFDALTEYLKENGFKSLVYKAMPKIYHKIPADEDLYALFRNKAEVYRTDISSTVDISANVKFSSLRKRGAKKAKSLGLEISESNDFDSFITLLNKALERHNASAVHTAKELEYLQSNFPNNIKLYTVKDNDNIISGVVIYETETVAHAQYIASSEEGKNNGGLDFLFSYLINEKYNNKKFFDFGISTEEQGLYLNEGLISQKEGFGARGIVYNFYKLEIK